MRYYLWTFVGLMLVVSSGCSKPIEFDVTFHNNCPGNMLQSDVVTVFSYFQPDPDNPLTSTYQVVFDRLDPGGSVIEEEDDGADLNGDGALDSGNLDDTPPDNDVLYMTLDYLDADDKPNASWVASAGTIVDGATVVVTINQYCVPTYVIQNPALAGICGSSTQSGVFRRVDSTLRQVIDGDGGN